MTNKQRLIVIIGIVISVVFLWLAFRDLNPAAFWVYIQQANLALLLFASLWFFAAVVMISLRWSFLLRSVKRVPLLDLIGLVCIGYMGNNVYPLRSGEILRIVLLQRNHGVPVTQGAVVTVAERMFDGIVMLTFVFISLAALEIVSPTFSAILSAATPIFVGALVVFFLLAARPNLLRGIVERITRIFPDRLRGIALRLSEQVLSSLDAFRTPADLIGTILTSYATWLLKASVSWIVAFAFGMQLDFMVMLLIVGVVNLAGLVPASPGQVGVFEFLVIAVLVAVGVNEAQASAYAVVMHLVIWLPVTLVGFILLIRQGLNWSAIARARDLESKAVTP
jgi:uncharacterized protein (TIRG00374 family)